MVLVYYSILNQPWLNKILLNNLILIEELIYCNMELKSYEEASAYVDKILIGVVPNF